MKVDVYEKYWMWGSALLLVLFVGALLWSAGAHAVHPPSHVETIDPTKVAEHPEFGNPGVKTKADGSSISNQPTCGESAGPQPSRTKRP